MSTLYAAAKAIWDFILAAVADLFVWLRKPGSKLRVVCAVLAFVTAVAAMRAYQAEQQIVLVMAACETDKGGLADTIAARDLTIEQKNAALAAIEVTLKAEAQRLRDLQRQNAGLVAENAAREKAADKSAAAFIREFNNKPPTCSAALAAMEAACPTLQGY